MRKLRKYFPLFLLFIIMFLGAYLLIYPALSRQAEKREAVKVVQSYEQEIASLDDEVKAREFERAEAYNELLSGGGLTDPFSEERTVVMDETYRSIFAGNSGSVMAYVEIPSIEALLPVYHTTDERVMRKGLGHLEVSAFPIGREGDHTVITGHSGLPGVELFRNLEQVEESAMFFIHIMDEIFAYEVDQILVVSPNQIDALRPEAGESYVTLITCTPYKINSHRLLVRGRKTEYQEQESEEEQLIPEEGIEWKNDTLACMICIIILRLVVKTTKRMSVKS